MYLPCFKIISVALIQLILNSRLKYSISRKMILNYFKTLKTFEQSWGFESELKWSNIFILTFYHTFGLYWCYMYAFPVKLQTVAFVYVVQWLSTMGIICGVHRLWCHRTYKARLPLKIFLMLCYLTSGQNPIYNWVRDHRIHHKFSDTDADPHNINRGFFFSHMGWLMMKTKKAVIEKGRQIDMRDIEADPLLMFERKYSAYLGIICCQLLPTLANVYLLGESWKCSVAWHNVIRYVSSLHIEWSVNSFAHAFGNKPYNKSINPTQNLWVSILTGGEGWHNYHHMFPYDYKASEFGVVNAGTKLIQFWSKIGLAYDLNEASPEVVQAVVKRQNNTSLNDL